MYQKHVYVGVFEVQNIYLYVQNQGVYVQNQGMYVQNQDFIDQFLSEN